MSINVNGNIISSTGFTVSGEIKNTPNIVTDGLVLWLDAGNVASYSDTTNYYDCGYGCQYYASDPGCSHCNAQWKDMSGHGNDGTLNYDAVISYTNYGGSIYFDGTSDSATIAYSSTMDFSLEQTLCMWLKPATGSDGGRRNPYNQAYGGSGTITHETAQDFTYFFGTNGGNSTPYVGISSGFGVAPNELAFITVTRSQTTNICRWYKNGTKYTDTNAGGYASTANGSNGITIGNGYAGGYIGNIYSVILYNRFFTDNEVIQNFNAGRQRFGV